VTDTGRDKCRIDKCRIDKWLWHARFCKTRPIAQTQAETGRIRLNGNRVVKSSVCVRVGDVMVLPAGGEVVALRVLGLGERRGPASEARTLYEKMPDEKLSG
jgi:ribosome-associated heat shock protein Hsp15